MELSKISAGKLTLLSALTALLCFTSICALGLCFCGYWKYVNTSDAQAERLNAIKSEIVAAERVLEAVKQGMVDKRAMMERMDEEYSKYIVLTNDIARLTTEKNAIQSNLSEVTNMVLRAEAAFETAQSAKKIADDQLKARESDLAKVNDAILAQEKKKVDISALEESLVKKRKELESIASELGFSEQKKKQLDADIAKASDKLTNAKEELAALQNKKEGLDAVIKEKESAKTRIEDDVARLEATRTKLEGENSELDREILIKSPKEKLLMDRLAKLAGDYIVCTNKLAEGRAQLRKEVAEAEEQLDADIIRRKAKANDEIEAMRQQAREDFIKAEERAAKILSDAKSAAKAIDDMAAKDKKSAEEAKAEKAKADLAAEKAKKDEETARSSMKEINTKVEASKTELARLQAEIKGAKEELEKTRGEVAGLRETERQLSESIKVKQSILSPVDKTSQSEEVETKSSDSAN